MLSNRVTRQGVSLLVLVALLATACQAQSASPAASGAASVEPGASAPAGSAAASEPAGIPQGGTLSIGWNGEIQWLDPALGYDVTSWPAERLIFEQLLAYDAGTNLVPLLADGMPSVSADGKTYTIKIHAGVNFVKPDGSVLREMTADDVAYSINRVLNPNMKPTPSPVAGRVLRQHRRRGRRAERRRNRPRPGSRWSIRRRSSSTSCRPTPRSHTCWRRHSPRSCRRNWPATTPKPSRPRRSGRGHTCSSSTPRARAPRSSRTRRTGSQVSRTSTRSTT